MCSTGFLVNLQAQQTVELWIWKFVEGTAKGDFWKELWREKQYLWLISDCLLEDQGQLPSLGISPGEQKGLLPQDLGLMPSVLRQKS